MADQISQELVDQPGQTAESGAAATGGGQAAGIDETAAVQGSGQEPNGDGETLGQGLPPELEAAKKSLIQDYHAKTQKLAEERRTLEAEVAAHKQDASYFRELAGQEWFKQALRAEKERRSGQVSTDIPDEVFEKVKEGDKAAFRDAVAAVAKALVAQQLGGVASREDVDKLKSEREVERLTGAYKDFKSLKDSGALKPFLDQGYDYETAYAKAKLVTPQKNDDVIREAEKLIQTRKQGAVHTTGVTQVKGGRAIKLDKSAGFDQAFDEIFKAVSAGEDVRVERERN